jgi:hypothetical protein
MNRVDKAELTITQDRQPEPESERTITSYPEISAISPEEGLRLVKAFVNIPDSAMRDAIVKFIEEIATTTT